MTTGRPRGYRLSLVATIALAALLVLNLPFYAGSSGDWLSWRMEHGRITLEASSLNRSQGFWLAPNAEGLRWLPEGRVLDPTSWELTLPLWIPLLACLGWHLSRRRARRREAS